MTDEEFNQFFREYFDERGIDFDRIEEYIESLDISNVDISDMETSIMSCGSVASQSQPPNERPGDLMVIRGTQTLSPDLKDCFWWSFFEAKMSMFGFCPTLEQYYQFLNEMQALGWFIPGQGTPIPYNPNDYEKEQKFIEAVNAVDKHLLDQFAPPGSKAWDSVWWIGGNYNWLNEVGKRVLKNVVDKNGGRLLLNFVSKKNGAVNGAHTVHVRSGGVMPDKNCKEVSFVVSNPLKRGDPDSNPVTVRVASDGTVINYDEVANAIGLTGDAMSLSSIFIIQPGPYSK